MNIAVVGIQIQATSYATVSERIRLWAQTAQSRYVCAANVHMIMEAWDVPDFRDVVNSADLVTPDGMPVVWVIRLKGRSDQQRVYGPTVMLHLLEMAARENISVGFYGGTPDVLEQLVKRMQDRFPGLNVPYTFSPPFRALTPNEDSEICQGIQESGVRILFVGLGCPKQEIWMAEHRGRVKAIMIGVGAAFDFHAGMKSQAPASLQRIGLEWLFRLSTEPRRLWRRYLYHNPRFVFLAIADLLGLLR